MKKSNLLTLILICIIFFNYSYSQKINFTNKITYAECETNEIRSLYYDTNNNQYFLEIRKDIFGFYFKLIDLNASYYHRFKVKNINENLVVNYEYSSKIDKKSKAKFNYDFYVDKEVGDTLYSKMIVYNDKKKKNIQSIVDYKILKGTQNLLYLYIYLYWHTLEFYDNLDVKGIILSVNYQEKRKIELISIEKINFEITIPDEINFLNKN